VAEPLIRQDEQAPLAGLPLSAVIITRDAASRIEPCLQSVSFADEILIVDSGSTDATLAIAQRFGARVIHQEWLGYGRQKEFAARQAKNHWVLSLDADERVSEELRHSIQTALKSPRFEACRMARCNRFMGRWLRHGEGYPDWSLRLYHREHAHWSVDPVHEKLETDGKIITLMGDLLHESEQGIDDYLAKQNRYTTLQAEELYRAGRRVNPFKMVLSPVFRFIKFYFLRLGFLDGIPGLVHITIGCFNSYCKYAKLIELSLRQR